MQLFDLKKSIFLSKGQQELIEKCIQDGVDLNVKNTDGQSLLHLSSKLGKNEYSLVCIESV